MGRANAHIWTGVPGASVSALTSLGAYPASPNVKTTTTVLSSATSGNSYGQRIFGYIVPPTSGSYTSASPRTTPRVLAEHQRAGSRRGRAKVCYLSNWVGRYTGTAYASQTSAYNLTEGVAYYFEILHKEDGGLITWTWRGPVPASPARRSSPPIISASTPPRPLCAPSPGSRRA
ncbi:MAG: hypothetical protein U1F77_11450 [Kiritimatiellia bacterium]